MFEAEAKRQGLAMSDVTDPEILPYILKRMAVTELDDVFASIGYGGMTAAHAVGRIRDEIIRRRAPAKKTTRSRAKKTAEETV